MVTNSNTLVGWAPSPSFNYSRPVQVGTVRDICGAELPDGKAVLTWNDGTTVKFAVVESPFKWLENNVVAPGDVGTITSPGGVLGSSVFVVGDGLYSIVHSVVSNSGRVELYQADSATSPTSWSLKSVLQATDPLVGPNFGHSPYASPIPIVLESGRWVLGGSFWVRAADWHGSGFWVWTSDDEGATWANRYQDNHIYFFARTSGTSVQLAQDPLTGYIYGHSNSGSGGVYNNVLQRGTSDGVSWGHADGGDYYNDPRISPFIDNGVQMYAFNHGGTNLYTYPPGLVNDIQSWYSVGSWVAPGVSANLSHYGIIAVDRVFFFGDNDKVMTPPLGGWTIDSVRMG